jgi:uncharacterized membrane protein YfcA
VTQALFVLALLATSIGAGAVGAILGLGGGILLVPVLTMFFGVNLHYAMGASLISVIATSSGAAAYLTSGLSNIRIGLFLAMATTVGAITGASLAGIVPERALQLTLGLALGYCAWLTFRQLDVEIPAAAAPDALALRFGLEGTYYDRSLGTRVSYRATRVGPGLAAMYGAGLLSGLLGIGSGAFKVLAMDYFMRLPMKVSTATSNFMIGITIHPVIVTPVAVGILLGAYLGTRLMAGLRNTTVRKLFLPVLIYLAVAMALRGLGVWTR